MKISEILKTGPSFSFEFGPPRTEQMEATLARTLVELEPLGPSYVSVTYGAGGSTRDRTHELVVQILRGTSMTPMAHLTCACHSRAELEEIVARYAEAGIENILALGGDPPKDLDLPDGELSYAIELVRLVRAAGDFCIGVAAHPEPHLVTVARRRPPPHAEKPSEADFAITQFFDAALLTGGGLRALGSQAGHPGIMPVTSIASVKRMAEMQGSDPGPAPAARGGG